MSKKEVLTLHLTTEQYVAVLSTLCNAFADDCPSLDDDQYKDLKKKLFDKYEQEIGI